VRPTDVRLTIYAAVTLAASVVALVAALGLVPETVGVVVVLLCAVPLLLSWGAYQADLVLNGALDEAERHRWRIAFFVLPPSMALYWLQYVRGRRVD
jgi:hypothetical protein